MIQAAAHHPARVETLTSGQRIARGMRWLGRIFVGLGVLLCGYLTWRLDSAFFTLSDAFFVFGAILLLCGGGIRLKPWGSVTVYWLAGFLIMIPGLFIGSVVNGDPISWLLGALQYSFALVLLPYLLDGQRHSDRRLVRYAMLLVAGITAMELFGVLVYYFYDASFQDYQKIGTNFITGSRRLGAYLGQPNGNSAIISMTLPFVIYLMAQGRIPRVVGIACAVILAQAVILTASFTGAVSSMIVVALFLFICGTRYVLQAAIGVAAAVGIFLAGNFQLPAVFQARVGGALESGDLNQAGTFADRMDLIREAWRMVDHTMFIGLGMDQYRVVSAMKAPVHNVYLLLWAEGGLLALVGWMLLLIVVLLTSLRTLRYDRLTAALGLAVLAAFVIFSTATPHMYARVWLVPLILAMAFMTRIIGRQEDEGVGITPKDNEARLA